VAKKSIYETSFAAGHTGGLYEADLQGVGDVWSDIEASQSMTALKASVEVLNLTQYCQD